MNNQIQISTNDIVFSKWTRKNYAIFASLNKIIKIARLSADVCISSLNKIQSIVHLLNREINIDEDEDASSVWEDFLSNLIITNLIQSGIIQTEVSHPFQKTRKYKSKSIFYVT